MVGPPQQWHRVFSVQRVVPLDPGNGQCSVGSYVVHTLSRPSASQNELLYMALLLTSERTGSMLSIWNLDMAAVPVIGFPRRC